jgi:hypothetical protein
VAQLSTLGGKATLMSISSRRKLGITLLSISVVALVVFLVVGVIRGHWRFDGSGSSGDAHWAAYSGELGVSEYYLIPILLCGAVGAFYLFRPLRKPPKLNQ